MSLFEKKILITGAHGFLGSHITERLKDHHNLILPHRYQADFRSQEVCEWVLNTERPDVIIHLAATVGGIGYNQNNPASLFYDNAIMGINLMHSAYVAGVEKFVTIGTVCAYPKHTPVPFKEEDLWIGYPEETNAPYGLAKKMLLVQSQSYRKQYGFNAIYLLPVNLYGEGDNFDPSSSHVIPALIRKFIDAQDTQAPHVTVWGSGEATREFLYVKDAAEAILLAVEKYNKPDPVNIGSSNEISIKDLALLIKKIVGYEGEIIFDTSKPDGQPRRKLDTTKAEWEFGFVSKTSFEEGLKETVKWYQERKKIIKHRENFSHNTYN